MARILTRMAIVDRTAYYTSSIEAIKIRALELNNRPFFVRVVI